MFATGLGFYDDILPSLQKASSVLNSLEAELENIALADHEHANDPGG